MNSKDSVSGAAEMIAGLSMKVTESAVKRGIEAGLKAAMSYMTEERDKQKKGRYDRRLRNTKLLLKNYRILRMHTIGAIYQSSQMKENAIDILDGLDDIDRDDSLYIESIKRSHQRTLIILNHIDEMLKYFRIYCEESGKEEELRGYRIIMSTYIDDEKISVGDIAERENIETRTVYKNIAAAVKPLSSLIFGIDSLRTM